MQHISVRAAPAETQEAVNVQILADIRYDHPCVSCVAPDRSAAYATTTLGNVGIIDLSIGRALLTSIPVGRHRALRLACSPNGQFLAVAYENGQGDLLAVELDATTRSAMPRHLTKFAYLVPQQETPCMRCTDHHLWYQDVSGWIASVSLGTGDDSPRALRLPVLDASTELGGIELWGHGLALTARKGKEGLACVSLPGREPIVHSFAKATPTALCLVGEDRLAIALSSARTAICRASRGLTEESSLATNEVTVAMTSRGRTLVGVTEMGVIWSADLSTPVASVRYARKSPAFLGAESLQCTSEDSFIIAAATGATRFRVDWASAPRPAEEFLEVFPEKGEGEAMAVCRKAGNTWMVRTNHPNEVAVANEVGLRTYAYDRRTGVFLSCGFDDSSVKVDVGQMTRGEAFRLPSEARCAADADGGFWLFVPPASLHYLATSGKCTKAADMGLEIAGPVQLHCWDETPPILTVEAPCRIWSKMGSDVYHTLCFYDVGTSLLGRRRLKKTGEWSVHAGEGVLEAWVYVPVLKQFLIKLSDRFCVGSARDLASGNGISFTVANLSEKCGRATVIPDSSEVFLLGASGTLYLLDAARRRLVAVYSGTSEVSQIAPDAAAKSIHAILDRAELVMFHLEEGRG